jgi:hypothetical protein
MNLTEPRDLLAKYENGKGAAAAHGRGDQGTIPAGKRGFELFAGGYLEDLWMFHNSWPPNVQSSAASARCERKGIVAGAGPKSAAAPKLAR